MTRKEKDRQRLRALLLAGTASSPVVVADADYFEGLRERVRERGQGYQNAERKQPG